MSSLLETIHLGFDTPENETIISHAGRIPLKNLRVAAAVLFGVAAFSVIARTIRRLVLFLRLKLDDAFVWFALICLGVACASYFEMIYTIILEEAIAMDPDVIVPINEIAAILSSITYIDIFLCTVWTCTFSVKASFLALFWHLIHGLSKQINTYYWVVVGSVLANWLFLVVEAFILCPEFGEKAVKCYPEDNYFKTLLLTILITVLDVTTDIMIAIIPILILRKSRTKLQQKFSLGIFLCLSFIMVIFALTRVGGLKRGDKVDVTWAIFWQFSEGCVACIMASIVPFRTLFVTLVSRKKKQAPNASPRKLSTWLKERLWRRYRTKSSDEANWVEMDEGPNALPRPPVALLSGLRTFIRRNGRSQSGDTSVMVTNTFDLEESVSANPERDYQNYLRKAALPKILESERSHSRQ